MKSRYTLLLFTRTLFLLMLPLALCQAQNAQQKLEHKFQTMFCNCFSDSLDIEDFQATLEREMECRAKFYQEHESAFDSVVTKESTRLAHLTAFEKDHFIDDEVMTNSILYFMKNCDVYTRTMTNIKTLYFQALDKRKQDGTLKSKKEFLVMAATDEKGKKYGRQAAEAYGNAAMLYELEGDVTQADHYYKKSLSVYPTPIMMAFHHLLKIKKK